MNGQKRIDELAAGHASRKRIELRAVSDLAKQPLRLIGPDAEQRDRPARRTQQPGHEIHQRRLPCPVWSNQTGDPGRDLEVDAIHAEYLAVKLGDVVEDDEMICRCTHLTTSYTFTFHESKARQATQSRNNIVHDDQSGGSYSTISRRIVPSKSRTRLISVNRSNVPKSPAVTFLISALRLTRFPMRVLKTSLMNAPNTEGIRNNPTN